MSPTRSLEQLLQDLRFGARLLARRPLFTLVAVLSLTLGIGANTAVFSVLNALVLRPLPVADPGELLIAQTAFADELSQRFSYPLAVDARARLDGRAEVCALSSIQPVQVRTAGPDPGAATETAQLQLYSGDCFELLRQQPQLGRLLGPGDDDPRAARPVAVITDSYWARRFARSPAAIGAELTVNGVALTIVGITQQAFFGATVGGRSADIWAPVVMQADLKYAGNLSNANGDPDKPWIGQRELSWLSLLLRVPAGRQDQAAAILNAAAQASYAQMAGLASDAELRDRLRASRIALLPGARGFSDVRSRLTTPLVVLLLMVGLVLTIACANLASLLLARAAQRQREMAVRLSSGAGRGRLIRMLLTESLLLALLGGAGGLFAARWGSEALVRLGETGRTAATLDVAPDWRVALFALAVSLLTGLLFGVLPAVRATRISLAEALKAQTRSVAGTGHAGAVASRSLMAGQIAVSLLLVVMALLFVRNLQQLMRTDVGFDRHHVLVARIDPRSAGFTLAEQPELQRRLLARVLALPGVTAASLSGNGPFSGSRTTSSMEVQGYAHDRDERLRTQEEVVTPDYFRTVGLRIVRGRGFEPADRAAGRKVTVINETMARRYFGGGDPVGRRWSYDDEFGADAFEIVGVVADARYNDVRADSLNMAYRPVAQSDWFAESLEVRTAGDPASMAPTLVAALREAEPRLPISGVETIDARVTRSLGQDRMLTWLASIFGAVALALACLGLYGTISYGVARRTSELGIRIALGAGRSSVVWLILRDALAVVAAGLAIGLPLAIVSSRALRGLLYGLDASSRLPYAGAALALLAVALLAAYLPARRASRLDPVVALRADP